MKDIRNFTLYVLNSVDLQRSSDARDIGAVTVIGKIELVLIKTTFVNYVISYHPSKKHGLVVAKMVLARMVVCGRLALVLQNNIL